MGSLLRQGDSVKFALVDAEKAEHPIASTCSLLGVSRSGFYAWKSRPESAHTVEDRRLAVLVRAAHEHGRKTYGSPRVHAELADDGEHVSKKRVARLMREQDLVARQRRRYKSTTMSDHDQPVAANLLGRKFNAEVPNQRWVGDTTELLVGASGAKLYLAVILDLFSRFVVGWAISAVNDRHLTIKALDHALRRRCPGAGLLHHSDQGCTYASEDYQDILAAHGITCSMSRRGNCYDNAAMESWNSTLKSELGERFESYGIAKEQLFDYIEVFYNQQRRHSALGYKSPAQYELTAHLALLPSSKGAFQSHAGLN
jgi:putative transposase